MHCLPKDNIGIRFFQSEFSRNFNITLPNLIQPVSHQVGSIHSEMVIFPGLLK